MARIDKKFNLSTSSLKSTLSRFAHQIVKVEPLSDLVLPTWRSWRPLSPPPPGRGGEEQCCRRRMPPSPLLRGRDPESEQTQVLWKTCRLAGEFRPLAAETEASPVLALEPFALSSVAAMETSQFFLFSLHPPEVSFPLNSRTVITSKHPEKRPQKLGAAAAAAWKPRLSLC